MADRQPRTRRVSQPAQRAGASSGPSNSGRPAHGAGAPPAPASASRAVPAAAGGPVQLAQFGCSPLAQVDPQALAVTYWFDAAPSGVPYSLSLRIVGRRAGAARKPVSGDSFDVHTSVPRVVPGMGRLAVTTRILDVTPGDWRVTVAPVADRSRPGPRLASGSAAGSTGWAPAMQVLAPGVRLGAWPVLVVVGAAMALSVQALLAFHLGLSVIRLFGVSLVACLLGVAGAKVYYLAWPGIARRGVRRCARGCASRVSCWPRLRDWSRAPT